MTIIIITTSRSDQRKSVYVPHFLEGFSLSQFSRWVFYAATISIPFSLWWLFLFVCFFQVNRFPSRCALCTAVYACTHCFPSLPSTNTHTHQPRYQIRTQAWRLGRLFCSVLFPLSLCLSVSLSSAASTRNDAIRHYEVIHTPPSCHDCVERQKSVIVAVVVITGSCNDQPTTTKRKQNSKPTTMTTATMISLMTTISFSLTQRHAYATVLLSFYLFVYVSQCLSLCSYTHTYSVTNALRRLYQPFTISYIPWNSITLYIKQKAFAFKPKPPALNRWPTTGPLLI